MENKALPTTTEALSVSNDKAAELLGVEPPSLDKDRRTGHLGIPYVKAGRRILYSLSDLQEWLDSNKRHPVEKEKAHAYFIIYGRSFIGSSRVIQPCITISALHPYEHYKPYSYCTNNVSTKPFQLTQHNFGTKNSSDEWLSRVRRTVLFSDALGLNPQKYRDKQFRDLRHRVHHAGSCDHITYWVSYSSTKFVLNEPYYVVSDYVQRLANQGLYAREIPAALSPYCGLWNPAPGAAPSTKSFLICDIANADELDLIVNTAEAAAKNLPDWNSLVGIVYV